MKQLFDKVSHQCSKATTKAYSTSFSLGIFFLNSMLRKPIYGIYGFVRFADEIVDSFEGYDRTALLEKFKRDTYEAIEERISLNPILNAFQHVVHDYNIELGLVDTFLQSMEMDLEKVNYTKEKYNQYILGSAEVVGLMCLHVFTEGNKGMYNCLKPYAMKLGAAFQKVNFLRDINSDYNTLGRVYFPNVNLDNFNHTDKAIIEKEIEQDFRESLIGIKQLPASSQKGVYLAYIYYRALFNKINSLPAQRIMQERIRISNGNKIRLMLHSLFRYHLNMMH